MSEGDRNMKLFHKSTLHNRSRNNISKIKNLQGEQMENPKKIAEIFVDYFKDTLNNFDSSNRVDQEEMLKSITKLITEEDNRILNKPFSLQEVKVALFNINPDNSLGPDGFQAFFFLDKSPGLDGFQSFFFPHKSPSLDGFQAFFFQQCWDILGEDLWKALEASRNGGSLLT